MKIRLNFKTPDVTDYALENLSEDEQCSAGAVIGKYVEYGEYLSVELDTVTGTATVIPIKE